MREYVRAALLIAAKDMRIEWRSREILSIMALFGVLAIFIFNFALDLSPVDRRAVTPGLLWVMILFAALLGLNRSFAREQDQAAVAALMLVPVDRSAIYVGKFLSTFLFLVAVEVVVVPLFAAMFTVSIPLLMLVPLLLGTLGIAIIGTLFAAMSTNTRLRDVLLPVLVMPLLVPVVIAGVNTGRIIMDGNSLWQEGRRWLLILAAFDVLFFTVSVLLFDFVLEE
nr:heme exporter protein CcmB [Ardenticatena sp.]